jgi:hypothetical protein
VYTIYLGVQKMAEKTATVAKPQVQSNGVSPNKQSEPKDVRFRRLAQRRVNKALAAIANVARLGNKAQYTWTPEQAAKIVSALGDAVYDVDSRFSGAAKSSAGFTL